MGLTKQQKERYKAQIVLPEIGPQGQQKLLNAKVLLIGCGGLGSSCAYYLTAAGIGTIGLVDHDKVELSNLHRQILHFTTDIGVLKVKSAKEKLLKLNPDIRVNTYSLKLNSNNITEILHDYDVIVDCSDNFIIKDTINTACIRLGKPFIHASVLKFYGVATTIIPGKTPCYRCILSKLPLAGDIPTCNEIGILGVVAGILGIIEAAEVIKYLLDIGRLLVGKLLIFDMLKTSFEEIRVKKNPKCPVCSK